MRLLGFRCFVEVAPLLDLLLSVPETRNGGKTSAFVRKDEKAVDMPLDSDVLKVPPGTLLIESKPQESTKHQYDWDAVPTANFLRKYGFIDAFKLNIVCNHTTLFSHSCHHELETATFNGLLGNIDANTGDPQVGWDTDQFLIDIAEATNIMLTVISNVHKFCLFKLLF
ncbi:hypothetical protein K1719_009490 [Acacia pycnantha]|nr:hypothetical protein K1719_009490 [Acacia pycnantha]